ncbi:MAG TPA: hypothetical protein GXZ64_07965 [Clostridiaceae bacterium]|jgi:hypothetical protein|nr:hypothetical protein [Clostridiaceae bacterium]
MDIKETIKNLIGVEVTTDDLKAIRENPEQYTSSKENAARLEELVMLLRLTEETEDQ